MENFCGCLWGSRTLPACFFVLGVVCGLVFSEHTEMALAIAILIVQLVLAPIIPATITAYLEALQPAIMGS